ncbi:MAG: hypothetical protein GWN82_17855 [Gemmatimonadetes bacterium]|nr:hypothetical protein [Gemmatimonadota bacterium]NIU32496.1 hypothetical protein [Gemmatimonadota bacterium]NIV62857.1 hypothetical protein [Gemmatimonadota bacterium]NIW65600.1 hypothetical protein [Gemmatimonadota bacterium]NIX45301.1 hypothetical protein [Gemmatimonadota bacterium]
MSTLEGPLKQRQAVVDVLRVHPLSVKLVSQGVEPVLETTMVALSALSSARNQAA